MAYKGPQMSMRVDMKLKNDFDVLCRKWGTSGGGAINLFIKKVIEEGEIPFPVNAMSGSKFARDGGKYADVIQRQIQQERKGKPCRATIRISGENDAAKEEYKAKYDEICKKAGSSISRVTKIFMAICVAEGKNPF